MSVRCTVLCEKNLFAKKTFRPRPKSNKRRLENESIISILGLHFCTELNQELIVSWLNVKANDLTLTIIETTHNITKLKFIVLQTKADYVD